MGFWSRLFPNSATRDQARYDREKSIAISPDKKDRLKLANNKKTHQEILYFLAAHDKDRDVREAVANNASTPVQASVVLSQDQDQDVRLALAERLVRLLPNLSEDKHSQLYAFAVQALGNLALDEVLKIRLALSSALKDQAAAPPKVASQLARDVERDVAEPVLRYCAAIPDEDLIAILSAHPASWAIQAIAGRATVAPPVSQAVIDTDDVPAGLILMNNEGAVISTDTLTQIVAKSKNFPEWQKPIATRKNLPASLARELADFVEESVRSLLLERTDYSDEDLDVITKTVRRRLERDVTSDTQTVEQRVAMLLKKKELDDAVITDAVAMRDREFVVVAMAALARTSPTHIEKIIAMKAPKPLIAVCFHAGLSMRTALLLQRDVAGVVAAELIYPRGGTDYPLSPEDISWQLDFLGLKK
jgi:uncharacterized protein (DUF2336 family)